MSKAWVLSRDAACVTLDALVAAKRLGFDSFFLDDNLGADLADDFFAVVCRNGYTHDQPILLRHQIALPSTPNDGVALAHEKAVAGIFEGTGIVGRRGVVEERDNPLAATIGSVVENLPVAAGHVHRFQNTEVAPVFDSPAPVSRCFVQVDDDFIQPILRIDFAVNLADEFFVGASNREFVTVGERRSTFNRRYA